MSVNLQSAVTLVLPFAYGGLTAGVAGLVLAVVCRFLLHLDARRIYPLPAAFGGGFLVAYVLLGDWAPLVPERYWQWLPYLGLVAAIVGAACGKLNYVEQLLLQLCLYWAAAIALTPTWKTLEPSRAVWIPVLAGGMLVLSALLIPLASRISSVQLMFAMALAGFIAVALIALKANSLKDAEITNLAVAALCACLVACACDNTLKVATVIPAYIVLLGGSVFTAHIYPNPPLGGLLVLPCAPLALWVGAIGPISRLKRWQRIAIQCAAVAAVLAVGVGLSMMRGG